MRASLTVKVDGLRKIAARLDDPEIRRELEQLPKNVGLVALVAQAIADNFAQEGPGWAPLKAQTIKRSVAKALRKKLPRSNKQLLADEASARKSGGTPTRQILRRSGLLMKAATTPGASGNVWRSEGPKLIYGTDLIYAGIHNAGGTIKHPGTNNGFGKKGLKIPAHAIPIPKREFMVIRDEWKRRLQEFVVEETMRVVKAKAFG